VPKDENYDGIYLAYFAAELGTSLGIFMLKDGVLCGADLGNGIYDGKLTVADSGKRLVGSIEFRTAQGGTMITGASSDLPVSYSTEVELSLDGVDFHSVSTISGPINVRFEKVRSI
jgi:hypothetical protein